MTVMQKLLDHFEEKEDFIKCDKLNEALKELKDMEECDIEIFYYRIKTILLEKKKCFAIYIVDKVSNRPTQIYLYEDITEVWRALLPSNIINKQATKLKSIDMTIKFT